METVADECARAAESLCQLEEAAVLLEAASKEHAPEKVSPGFPGRVAGILNALTAISSREDAERLLATGVAMWNSVIVLEACEVSQGTTEALVKVRHVAADCMYMSTTVLGGISARYNIDDLNLLKFYTACGQKYATVVSDMEMAEVCFSKAAEFVEAALNETQKEDGSTKMFAAAMFDLSIGRAECAWEKGEDDQAEGFVSDARKYMAELPGEHEFLASVEYNFGLFAYQAKETERALKWLTRSMETRGQDANTAKDLKKQAKTARLAGVCLLAMQDYQESWKMMMFAEETSHDPVGSYLLLKLCIIAKKPDAVDVLFNVIQDTDTSLDLCMASIALFADAQRTADAVAGYERLFTRFKEDPVAIANTVGPRYFEVLSALGKIDKALDVLDDCCASLEKISEEKSRNVSDAQENGRDQPDIFLQLSRWSALLLTTGSVLADRKNFSSAAKLLSRCLVFARNADARRQAGNGTDSSTMAAPVEKNVVIENEAAVCRLVSSCALCSAVELNKGRNTVPRRVSPSSCPEEESKSHVKEFLDISLAHAQRAKSLEPSDFAPRLLIFRTHLLAQEFELAASELRDASVDIRSFDPGALAEAACAARDVGSRSAVVAALCCVLNLDPSVLCNALSSTDPSCPMGFFGKVLLSCIHILLEEMKDESVTEKDVIESGVRNEGSKHLNNSATLLKMLRRGLVGLQQLGLEGVFGDRKETVHASLTYLTNVCWNKGREHGDSLDYKSWESFFDICFQYCSYLPSDAGSMQTMRMSKLMCACASIEDLDSGPDDFSRARQCVQEARLFSQKLHELSPSVGEDPIEGLLVVLEARCCVGCQNLDSLALVVEHCLSKRTIGAAIAEQLSSVCYNYRPKHSESNERLRCLDLTAALLSKASDIRLCSGGGDLKALSVTIREHLGVELSRGSNSSRAYKVLHKAIGVVVENSSEFPMDERRWLMAVSWDRAQMLRRIGQKEEARRWLEGAKQLAEGCAALSTYTPRLNALLGQL